MLKNVKRLELYQLEKDYLVIKKLGINNIFGVSGTSCKCKIQSRKC